MAQPGFIKNFDATSDIASYRIVSLFNVDFTVQQAADVSQTVVGVSEHGSDNSGRCDVVMSGIGAVEFGGDIVTGNAIVADSDGKAIAFVKANHADDDEIWVLGTALENGDAGTVGTVTINPFLIVK